MKRRQEGKWWTVKLVVREGTFLLTTRQVARRTFHKLKVRLTTHQITNGKEVENNGIASAITVNTVRTSSNTTCFIFNKLGIHNIGYLRRFHQIKKPYCSCHPLTPIPKLPLILNASSNRFDNPPKSLDVSSRIGLEELLTLALEL